MNADLDPATQINADPCGYGYGSATLPGPLDDQAAQRQVAAQNRRHQPGLVRGLEAALLPGLEKTRVKKKTRPSGFFGVFLALD